MPKKGLKSFQINLNFPIQNISIWLLVESANTELAQNCFSYFLSLSRHSNWKKTFRISNFISTESFISFFYIYFTGSKSKYIAMYVSVFIWHELHIFIAHSKEAKKSISNWWEHKKSMGHSWKFYRSICVSIILNVTPKRSPS